MRYLDIIIKSLLISIMCAFGVSAMQLFLTALHGGGSITIYINEFKEQWIELSIIFLFVALLIWDIMLNIYRLILSENKNIR